MNTSDILIWAANKTLQTYRMKFLFGYSLVGKKSVWLNPKSALHAAPLSVYYHTSTLVYDSRNITVINEPVTEERDYTTASVEYENMEAFGIDFPILIAIIMSIMISANIVFYIEERACRAKFMQYVNGVNISVFWIISILWDLLISILTIILIVLMLYASERVYWSEINTSYIVACIILAYNIAMLPIICLLSLIFSDSTTGIGVVTSTNTFICMAMSVNNYAVKFIPANIKPYMSVIPTCAMIESFSKLTLIGKECLNESQKCDPACDQRQLCIMDSACCPQISFLWEDEDIHREILFMAGTSLVAFIVLLIIETEILKQIGSYALYFILSPIRSKFIKHNDSDSDDSSDSDSSTGSESNGHSCSCSGEDKNSENGRIGEGTDNNLLSCFVADDGKNVDSISSMQLESQKVIMKEVSKYYFLKLVVDRMSFNIKDGECVGLIGKNGTGKTTIFKMLTGEQRICKGKAFILGMNLKWRTKRTYNFVGYCPQIDGFFENFTARETLSFFSLLRGSPSSQALDLANKLDLTQHLMQRTSQLSGGNKRKLSIVIALIGNPRILFLDEPTTDLDMKTRRYLWTLLTELCNRGKSILLSSDCMEDYQALCTRLVITRDSDTFELQPHTPTKLELTIKSEMWSYSSDINDFIQKTFKESKLISNDKSILIYEIPLSKLKWSALFNALEKKKRQIHIEGYSIYLK